ncbi:RNA-guided endonuclease InsQ/TnpB family protein [Salininema proteolyticum]|uniref:RNA-guided endonuclease InsQ/TnpB family protein n=1 Tax=Salininema proteolyticum TaxID=1607685 RepID=A0ABV8TZ18_9ACTN
MFLRYRFRIYPTARQRGVLARTFGCVRVVYNDAIAARQAAYRNGKRYPSTAELDRRLITWAKTTPERSWLSEVSTVPLQQALRDCHKAYRAFFDSMAGRRRGPRVGPPRFKSRSNRQAARFTRRGFQVRENGRLFVAKVGELRVAWSRDLPSDPSSATIIKTPAERYYVSFVVAVKDGAELLEPIADPDAETGIDLGLKEFAVMRGGRTKTSPGFFRRMERKLRNAQRALSRRRKGSKNRDKARREGRRLAAAGHAEAQNACGAQVGPARRGRSATKQEPAR